MNAYLSTLTVKTLREIAKRIGFRFIGRYRKAELITLIIAEINASHVEAIRENRYYGSVAPFGSKVSAMDYPAIDGRVVTEAHAKICASKGHAYFVKDGVNQNMCPRCGESVNVMDDMHAEALRMDADREVTEDTPRMGFLSVASLSVSDSNPIAAMRMSHSDPIDDVIRFARESIKALTPTLLATKTAFESLRDDESANPNHVDLAYQVYSDTYRSIEEYKRTIAYAADDHICENNYREVAMTEECAYGCKIYRCGKCQDERTLHNATYGCRYTA